MAKKNGFGFSIGLDISDFEKNCKKLNKLIDKALGANLVSLSNNAVKALGAITGAVAGIGIAAYNLGSKMDTLKTAFEGTWGSAKKANDQYERLRKISENSNYGLDQLQKVDSQMRALGLSADDAAEMVARLADVGVAKNFPSLEGLSQKLLQIKTTGQVSAKALKDFAEAGIEIADLAGKDATIAINLLMERLNKFNGYLENEATDIWSQIPRAVKIVQDAIANLGNYLNDNFKGYVVGVVNVVSDLRDRFKAFLNDKNGIDKAVQTFKALGIALATIAVPALVKFSIALAPVALQTMAITAAVVALTEALNDAFNENSQLFKLAGNFFEWLYFKIGYYIALLKEKFFRLMANIEGRLGNNDGALRFSYSAEMELREMEKAEQGAKIAWNGLSDAAKKLAGNSITNEVIKTIEDIIEPLSSINANTKPLGGFDRNPKSNPTISDVKTSMAPILGGSSLFASLAESYEQLKAKGVECWDMIKSKAIEVYQAYAKQQEELARQKELFKDWEKGIKHSLGKTFSDAFEEALKASGNFFKTLGDSLKNLGKQVLAEISKMLVLTFLFRSFGIKSGSFGVTTVKSWHLGLMNDGKVNDGVIQNGKIISTHPDDYIIATKNPSRLGGSPAKIIVNVNNNSSSEVTTNSYFDGTKQVIDIFIEGLSRNVSGVKDAIRAI